MTAVAANSAARDIRLNSICRGDLGETVLRETWLTAVSSFVVAVFSLRSENRSELTLPMRQESDRQVQESG